MKPSLPQGTRDFGPETVRKRQYIFNTIRSVFELYGFILVIIKGQKTYDSFLN